MDVPTPLTAALLGAGSRGFQFANWIKQHPNLVRLVAVAEPNAVKRQLIAREHSIPRNAQFEHWEDFVVRQKRADFVIITLMDHLHAASAIKAMERGYHVFLEKPMAPTLAECCAIESTRTRYDRVVCVCHSMRHHPVYAEVHHLLQESIIGDIVSLDHIEGIEPIHFSNSFVRGKWAEESATSFALLTKSSHDLDLITYLINRRCKRVASFGSLTYFAKHNAPVGAPDRCTDGCPVEASCPYSATKIYLNPESTWAWKAKNLETPSQRMTVLAQSPYARCVFGCDNDVVDHQVVNMEFEGGITATFTMVAFDRGGRRTRIHGTLGTIEADADRHKIEIWKLGGAETTTVRVRAQSGTHGGADAAIMENFVQAMRERTPQNVITSARQSLDSHRICFAAEKSRLEGRMVEISELECSNIVAL